MPPPRTSSLRTGELWGLQTLAVIWICGRSLMRAIDTSLQQQAAPNEIEGTKACEEIRPFWRRNATERVR